MTKGTEKIIDRLRSARSAEDLLRYFVEELDWPLEDETLLEDEDLDELIFEEDLEELGIPLRIRSRFDRIRQVRPADYPPARLSPHPDQTKQSLSCREPPFLGYRRPDLRGHHR